MGNRLLKDRKKIACRGGFKTRPYKGAAHIGKKGQSAIETSLAFVAVVILLAGMVKIWFWANNQIVERQIYFNNSRVFAGKGTDTYKLEDNWPVYTPPALNEKEP
jgi:flagellin-like protein